MSAELLAAALESGALEPTPSAHELAVLHLPFDDLRGGSQVESRTAEALKRWERVALVGPSGCGKSSVIAHITHSQDSGLAAIPTPVTGLEQDQVAEPVHVVRHLVGTVQRLARTPPRAAVRLKHVEVTAGLPWLEAGVAAEIDEQAREVPSDLAGAAEVLQQLLDTIAGDDLVPVVVFDDTDRWRAGFGFDDPVSLRESFFNRTLRWMAEQIECGVVVAAHDSYLADGGRFDAVSDHVTIPGVGTLGHLTRLLNHRLRAAGLFDATVPDIMDGEALKTLYDVYGDRAERSLRTSLSILRQASQEALDAGLEHVNRHVLLAAAAG